MKKIIALLLVLVMSLSFFAACGEAKPTATPTPTQKPEDNRTAEELLAAVDKTVLDALKEAQASSITAEDIAAKKAQYVQDVKDGFYPDVTEADIEKMTDDDFKDMLLEERVPFLMQGSINKEELYTENSIGLTQDEFASMVESGAWTQTMMGMAYKVVVLKLNDEADVSKVVTAMKEKADPAWNICTSAERKYIASSGKFVVLAMVPADFADMYKDAFNSELTDIANESMEVDPPRIGF